MPVNAFFFLHLQDAKNTIQFKELFSLVCYFFALNLPSSALNHLKTAFILTNQIFFSFILLVLNMLILMRNAFDIHEKCIQ